MVFIPSILTFAVLHIFGAVGWLAANAILAFGLDKHVKQMSEGAQKEFRGIVFPNLNLQYRIYSGMTILFGILFALAFSGGDLGFYLSNPIGGRILIGGILGLFAWLLGNTRYFRWLTRGFMKLGVGELELYVLVIVFLFMVASAHPYI